MSDYTKSTNFASKDSLSVGNPLKIVKGTEIDTEFNNIATAVATKADIANPVFTGAPSAPTASVNTNTTQLANTAFVIAQIADDAPTKTGTGASGTWGIDINGKASTLAAGGSGGNAMTFNWVAGSGQPAWLWGGNSSDQQYVFNPASLAVASAATDNQHIGISQTWQNVTGSRASSTTYTNSTTRPITVLISGGTNSSSQGVSAFYVNGVQIFAGNTSTQTVSLTFSSGSGSFIVPPGATYSATFSFSSGTIWAELR